MPTVTISNKLIESENEDMIISRIPGKNDFLHLDKKNVLTRGEYTFTANIEADKLYTWGGMHEESPAALIRGESLLKYYKYEKDYDPSLRTNAKTEETEAATSEKANQKTAVQYPKPNQPYDKEQFRQIRLGEKHHVDITKYWDIRLQAEQMKELRLMLEQGVDIEKEEYASPEVSVQQLQELRKLQERGYTTNYEWKVMNAEQMREIRLGMEKGVDTKQYSWPAYDAEQMKQLRLGLEKGFDITNYKNPHFSAEQMYNLRCRQIWERIKQHLRELWQTFKENLHLNNLSKIYDHVKTQVSGGLDKVVSYIENPVETLDDRINETIQDIKELLVAQELADESILTDDNISQRMNERIRAALDDLMQPENVQSPENQEAIMNAAADDLVKDTGAEQVMENQKEELAKGVHEQTKGTLTNKDLCQMWVDMDMEDLGKISDKTYQDVKDRGFSIVTENDMCKVVELEQEIQQQAMDLVEQAEQMQAEQMHAACSVKM